MKLGLFLDVDGVLTDKAINLQYAHLLGIQERLVELERQFANREITNDQFNAVFIPLFRRAGFTQQFACDNFKNVQMRTNSDDLLRATSDTFLVTSGPSYFIDVLAKEKNVPEARVLCSRYEFDDDGLLSRCSRTVTSAMKGTFVQARAREFDVAIGVGDTEQDFEFLSHCNIRVLMGGNRLEYFTVRELQPILDVIAKFQSTPGWQDEPYRQAIGKLHQESSYSKNVFIITPFRYGAGYRESVRLICETLKELGLRGWVATDRTLDAQLWNNVQAYLIGCKAGIALFTRDRAADTDGSPESAVVNPNVSIEVGYMLARGKPVLLLKDKRLSSLPTDMIGFLYEDFDLENAPESLPKVVRKWVDQLF
jgi:phosphoserine phosphatase